MVGNIVNTFNMLRFTVCWESMADIRCDDRRTGLEPQAPRGPKDSRSSTKGTILMHFPEYRMIKSTSIFDKKPANYEYYSRRQVSGL